MSGWRAVTGLQVAIDGPSGSGKGTVAKRLAEAIGLPVLDTGLLYRFIGGMAMRRGVGCDNADALAEFAAGLLPAMDWREDGVWFEGERQDGWMRGEDVARAASQAAASERIRAMLLEVQRQAARRGCVMDGRDIGTVVLPEAQAKFFLTASQRERARRRWAQLRERGQPADLDEILADLKKRDARDAGRQHAPLRQARDAIVIDSTTMRIDEVVDRMLTVLARRGLIEPSGDADRGL
ncbi:MAG: (d)CMP kinase [Mariprofundaceae bacterium]